MHTVFFLFLPFNYINLLLKLGEIRLCNLKINLISADAFEIDGFSSLKKIDRALKTAQRNKIAFEKNNWLKNKDFLGLKLSYNFTYPKKELNLLTFVGQSIFFMQKEVISLVGGMATFPKIYSKLPAKSLRFPPQHSRRRC